MDGSITFLALIAITWLAVIAATEQVLAIRQQNRREHYAAPDADILPIRKRNRSL